MSEKRSELTDEAISEVVEMIKGTKAFVLKESPAVAREIVFEGRVSYAINFVMTLVLAVQGLYALEIADSFKWGDAGVGAHIFMSLRLIGLFWIFGLFPIERYLKPFVAPKLFILSQLKNLVSKSEPKVEST